MRRIIYDRKQLSSYKEFYTCVYNDLGGKDIPDWEDMEDLLYNANVLEEFLWYCHYDDIHFIFKNFDLDKIENYKNYENYEWNIIFTVIKRFVQLYPNNTLEFISDEK